MSPLLAALALIALVPAPPPDALPAAPSVVVSPPAATRAVTMPSAVPLPVTALVDAAAPAATPALTWPPAARPTSPLPVAAAAAPVASAAVFPTTAASVPDAAFVAADSHPRAAPISTTSPALTATPLSSASPLAITRTVAEGPAAPAAGWVYPVGPPGGPVEVVNGFDPPEQPWSAGHRGVDLAATAGGEVRAAGPGTVTYAGPLAGRGVVVIDHGSLRTTYEPVAASVAVGDEVGAGQPIGTLQPMGSHCAPASCLHWGAREGERYTDPLALVGGGPPRLLPLGPRTLSGAPPPPPSRPPPSGGLAWPVAAPRVTSPYGMRVHPITGERKLHDGADLAAACGSPVRASAAGRVTHAGQRGAYGLQLTVDHGPIRGAPLTTSYSHLSAFSVTAGQPVRAGQVIGRAGTTGLSTGCHLHFMLYATGRVTDPVPWLPTTSGATSYLAKATREGYRR